MKIAVASCRVIASEPHAVVSLFGTWRLQCSSVTDSWRPGCNLVLQSCQFCTYPSKVVGVVLQLFAVNPAAKGSRTDEADAAK